MHSVARPVRSVVFDQAGFLSLQPIALFVEYQIAKLQAASWNDSQRPVFWAGLSASHLFYS